VCTADLGFTGGKNDIGAGTDTDFIGACTPALIDVANEMLAEFVRFRKERGNDFSGPISGMELGERL
jgi:uncharacterized protein (DUF2237 family)